MAREGNFNWKSTNNQDVKQQMQIRLCLGLPVTTPLVPDCAINRSTSYIVARGRKAATTDCTCVA